MANATFGIKQYITQIGVIAADVDIINDTVIKLITNNAASGNEITVYGRLGGQNNWNIIGTVNGSEIKTFDVSLFDYVRLECTNFSAVGTRVELTGSGFELVKGLNSISTPNGDLTTVDSLVLTSSDNSITITPTSPNIIDLKSLGGASLKYTKTVALVDWIGPSAGEYSLTIPFSFHAIQNPTVSCFEDNGGLLISLLVPYMIDIDNNVTFIVSENPDTRFIGKIIIE